MTQGRPKGQPMLWGLLHARATSGLGLLVKWRRIVGGTVSYLCHTDSV